MMNKGVSTCFRSGCYHEPTHRQLKYLVVEDIIGFAKHPDGMMVIWRCKSCDQIYFFHMRENEADIPGHDIVIKYHEFKTSGKWEYR